MLDSKSFPNLGREVGHVSHVVRPNVVQSRREQNQTIKSLRPHIFSNLQGYPGPETGTHEEDWALGESVDYVVGILDPVGEHQLLGVALGLTSALVVIHHAGEVVQVTISKIYNQ